MASMPPTQAHDDTITIASRVKHQVRRLKANVAYQLGGLGFDECEVIPVAHPLLQHLKVELSSKFPSFIRIHKHGVVSIKHHLSNNVRSGSIAVAQRTFVK